MQRCLVVAQFKRADDSRQMNPLVELDKRGNALTRLCSVLPRHHLAHAG
tara:strand:- start:203 stop:349 length:147 start_codon:yes stop_codon:yes gene_type:complete